jgi:hypothetical protein
MTGDSHSELSKLALVDFVALILLVRLVLRAAIAKPGWCREV